MRGVFVVLARPSGASVDAEMQDRFDRSAERVGIPPLTWESGGCWAVGLGPAVDRLRTGPFLVRTERLLVVGNARLDHRDEVLRSISHGSRVTVSTDLGLVAHYLESRGSDSISDLLGDFAFVALDHSSGHITAGRDAFGCRRLFFRRQADLITFSSRSALLSDADAYDLEWIADYFAHGVAEREPTMYAGVHSVGSGALLHVSGRSVRHTRYWRADSLTIHPESNGESAADRLRELLLTAVRERIPPDVPCWAQLSGGLDSSSIVAVADRLHDQCDAVPPLQGTVTLASSLPDGDELVFSEEVIRLTGLRNEVLSDVDLWFDPLSEFPVMDKPGPQYPYTRSQRMHQVVRSAGGEVLLSGYGGDHYLVASLYFLADELARGHLRSTARQLGRWAVAHRTSAWRVAYENVLFPLIPRPVRRRLLHARQTLPTWIAAGFASTYDLLERSAAWQVTCAPAGRHRQFSAIYNLREFGISADQNWLSDHIEVRYPFLYRPLIEFALALSPEQIARPNQQKWVLREAMRGILPDRVRHRTRKGGMMGQIDRTLRRHRCFARELAKDSKLAQLGAVDPKRFESAVRDACAGATREQVAIFRHLALEMWLRVRSGEDLTWGGSLDLDVVPASTSARNIGNPNRSRGGTDAQQHTGPVPYTDARGSR